MSIKLGRLLQLSEAVLKDFTTCLVQRTDLLETWVLADGCTGLSPQEKAQFRQEVDRMEQQSAQVQFRLDELERDFSSPEAATLVLQLVHDVLAGNRFPQIQKGLKRCWRILRDQDWDAASSSSSSSGADHWDRHAGTCAYMQCLNAQLQGLAKCVRRQQAQLQALHNNLWNVQRALAKVVNKQRAAAAGGSSTASACSSPQRAMSTTSPQAPGTPSPATPGPAGTPCPAKASPHAAAGPLAP